MEINNKAIVEAYNQGQSLNAIARTFFVDITFSFYGRYAYFVSFFTHHSSLFKFDEI